MIRTVDRIKVFRSAVGLLSVAALSVGSIACNESSLTSFNAEFMIAWDEDRGFNSEVDHLGVLTESMIQFGDVTTGAVLVTEVQLINAGDKALGLCALELVELSFEGEGEEMELSNEMRSESNEISHSGTTGRIGSGETFVFEMRFTPLRGEPLAENLYLSVKHDLNWDCDEIEDGETGAGDGLWIPIFGVGDGDPVPNIYANPATIEFAEVILDGSSQTQTLTSIVGNNGPGLLEVAGVSIGDSLNFSLDAATLDSNVFAMGETTQISIDFHPLSAGNHSTVVSIYSNDPNESPLEILVFGVANPPAVGKAPVAVCGPTIQSAPFMTESLDGTASHDPSNLILSYSWTFAAPPGSQSALNNPTSATPTTTISGQNYGLDLAGTYTGVLTVTNSQGTSSQPCTQLIEATPNENFRVELFWSKPDDMDLHLVSPGGSYEDLGGLGTVGTDCYYANCTGGGIDWGTLGVASDNPSLDIDDIPGTGPENTNIVNPANGTGYTIIVHDYPYTEIDNSPTDCTVNIYLNGVLMQTYNFSISGEDAAYYVAEIDWPSGLISGCNGLAGC
jgi:hypothetical protein